MRTSRHLLRNFSETKIESPLAALILALLISSLFFAGEASAQTSANAQQQGGDATTKNAPRGRSTVRGRVVYDDSGQPLSGVAVFIDKRDFTHQGAGTETNERGEFSFADLSAGKYMVRAVGSEIMDNDGILPAEGTAQSPIVELDGTSGLSVQLRVRRGGWITGQVTRANGSPAIGARIMLMIKRDGRMFSCKHGSDVRTDQQGFYRFPGLQTGEYMVSADELTPEAGEDTHAPRDTGYGILAATLYPSTTKISDAVTVHVDEGGETGGINITLVKRGSYQVSGTIRTLRGRLPRGEVSVFIQEKDERNLSAMQQFARPDVQGRWSFDAVPDGTYIIEVIPTGTLPPGSVDTMKRAQMREELVYPFQRKRQEVTVVGADLKGLVIEVSEGASVSGTVEMESGQPLPADMSIGVQADFSVSAAARVRPDRTFKLEGIPAGNFYPYIYTTSFGESSWKVSYDEYYVKLIYMGGTELQGEPLKVEEGAEIKGVRLVLSRELATVTGYVRSAKDGTPQRGINVVLLPTDPARQRLVKGLSFGFTDARGAFCASGPPGEYFVVAFGESDLPVTDEKMKALAMGAPRVRLRPNERRNVDLTRPGGK